jgi:molybdenum cofactor synthesis domain-containing protein
MVAVLAAFGYAEVAVARRPRVVLLTTGSEVVEINERPGPDQIRNSNAPMLCALVRSAGGEPLIFQSVSDDLGDIKNTMRSAAAGNDVLIVTGGVSVGKYDLTKTALAELGAEIYFEKLKLKPGKPAVFARVGNTIVFGLPGNPVSAAVTFYLFVRKALLLMQSANNSDLRRARAVAGGPLRAARERDTYLPAKLEVDADGRLTVTPLKWLGSSDFIGFARADALAQVSAGSVVLPGEIADILFL